MKNKDKRKPIDSANKTYTKKNLLNNKKIEYDYPNIDKLLNDAREEYQEIKNSSGIAIDRVKNNIKEGDCIICLSNLSDDDDENIIITKCCGVILCNLCCFGTIFPNKSEFGQCSNCRKSLNLKSIIYLNNKFNVKDIIEEKFDENEEEIKEIEEEKRNKTNAIIEIINGITPKERTEMKINTENLIMGNSNLFTLDYRKVLIFANYKETIDKVITSLNDNKIKYWKLEGNHNNLSKIVNNFNDTKESCALVINSINNCAGINLQTCTDLIFFHSLLNKNIETQLIGRGQRIGRTTQLKIHYMFYDNEYNKLF
jgi:SNF2 family DNA or RNA helicase